MPTVAKANPNQRKCATCASWFGGARTFEKGEVKYDPNSTGQCNHPTSSYRGKMTRANHTCAKWTPAF